MYYARIGQAFNIGPFRFVLPPFETHAQIDAWIDQVLLS